MKIKKLRIKYIGYTSILVLSILMLSYIIYTPNNKSVYKKVSDISFIPDSTNNTTLITNSDTYHPFTSKMDINPSTSKIDINSNRNKKDESINNNLGNNSNQGSNYITTSQSSHLTNSVPTTTKESYKAFITYYTYDDNDCNGKGGDCIHFPQYTKNGHAGGIGTKDDPITGAVDISNDKEPKAGTLLYIPTLNLYVRVADDCHKCDSGVNNDSHLLPKDQYRQLDIWLGHASQKEADSRTQDKALEIDIVSI